MWMGVKIAKRRLLVAERAYVSCVLPCVRLQAADDIFEASVELERLQRASALSGGTKARPGCSRSCACSRSHPRCLPSRQPVPCA